MRLTRAFFDRYCKEFSLHIHHSNDYGTFLQSTDHVGRCIYRLRWFGGELICDMYHYEPGWFDDVVCDRAVGFKALELFETVTGVDALSRLGLEALLPEYGELD